MVTNDECQGQCCLCLSRFSLVDSVVPWKTSKRHCYNCGALCCLSCIASFEPLPKFGFLNSVPVCLWCFHFTKLRTKLITAVHHVTVGELRLYLALLGARERGLLEKQEFVDTVCKIQPNGDQEELYRRNVKVLASYAAPLLRDLRQNGTAFTVSGIVSQVHAAVLQKLLPPTPQLNVNFGVPSFSERPLSTLASSSGDKPLPIAERRALPNYTLKELIALKKDPDALNIKQLRFLLRAEGVSFANVLEKSELVAKAQLLFGATEKEEKQRQAADSGSGDERMCKVCFERITNSVLLDCGHVVMCFPCAEEVFKVNRICPVCRSPIVKVVRTFSA